MSDLVDTLQADLEKVMQKHNVDALIFWAMGVSSRTFVAREIIHTDSIVNNAKDEVESLTKQWASDIKSAIQKNTPGAVLIDKARVEKFRDN